MKERKFCLNCGNEIIKKSQKKFCSNECQNEYYYKEYIKEWLAGKEDGLRGEYQTSNYIRRYLFEKNNNKCEICGWGKMNKYTKKIPLQIHHIDGDYLNNKPENLMLICPNCHSLTDSYGSLNKGNGIPNRQIARKKHGEDSLK